MMIELNQVRRQARLQSAQAARSLMKIISNCGTDRVLPPHLDELEILGRKSDRTDRNRLRTRWLVKQCAKWVAVKVALRHAHGRVPPGGAITRQLAGLAVPDAGGGVLMACLAPAIASTEVDALATGIVAWRNELAPAGDTTCVFLASAFADDIAKTNLPAILEQHDIQNVRRL